MRFLGNKDSLTDDILQLMTEKGVLDKDAVFFDAFCGMGSVCDSVKQTFPHLIINDILHCCTTFTEGRLYANGCKFETLGFSPFDFFANNPVVRKGFIYSTYAPKMSGRMYFTDENASRIDYFRYQIEEWYQEYRINDREYKYLLACLLEAVSSVSNTAGVYGAFLKHWDARAIKPIEFLPIDSKTGIADNVRVFNQRIEDIIADIDCDVLYLDPPYTQNQYGTQYHLLETLILNDNPTVSEVTGSRPTTPMRSDWSKQYYSQILFERVVALTKAKHIIFSYNNDGFISPDFVESTFKRFGYEQTYECRVINYKKYNNFKCQGAENHCEYLFYVEKKPTSEVVLQSPLNYTGCKAKMIGFIKQNLPNNPIHTFIDLFGGGFNVGINIDAEHLVYNDINPFVNALIRSFESDTVSYLRYIDKLIKQYQLAPDYKEGYLAIRETYNKIPIEKRDPRMLYTLILYGFQQQIRFNSAHEFNNPPGSRWFNGCLQSKFISFSRVLHQRNVEYTNTSFENLLERINPDTFVYADPPYRATLGVYNDGKRGFEGWTLEHEQKMCNFLDAVTERGSKFMLSYVLQIDDFYNKEIADWANHRHYNIIDVPVTQGRYNNRKEIIITNY